MVCFGSPTGSYGKGIVPKAQMITLPLHPHCMCRYDPYYLPVTKRHVADPEKETMAQFREDDQRRILGSRDAWRRWREGTPAETLWNEARPKYPIRRYGEMLRQNIGTKNSEHSVVGKAAFTGVGYNDRMEKFKSDLKDFIKEITTGNIRRNDVHIAYFSKKVASKLKTENIDVENDEIYLSVSKYKHIIRDIKRETGKAIPDKYVFDIYKILNSPSCIKFDMKKKNILYFAHFEKDKWIKIVVQPNFKTGKTTKNYVITAGIVRDVNLNDKFYESIL